MQDASDPQQQQPVSLLASVLIVSHNRVESLRRCLAALEKSQERPRLDVIVLDTGSRDGSARLDADFPEMTFLRMPRNFGATKALNIGIRSAKADLLLLLDPGVELPPNAIPALAQLLGQTPDAGALCPLLVDPSGQPIPQVSPLPSAAILKQAWRDPSALSSSVPPLSDALIPTEYGGRKALLVRKTFLKGMNYFDERYGDFGGDLELAFQIRHASKKTFIAPQVRATDHSPAEAAPSYSDGQQATLAADRLNGAAHFHGKRAGFAAEWMFRIGAILGALGRVLTFQRPGYNLSLVTSLISSQKIDGSQSNV